MEKIIYHQLTDAELRKIVSSEMQKVIDQLLLSQSSKTNRLLSRKEAAEKLKITLPTLYAWTKKGMLQSYNIGGRVLYKEDELEAALHKTEQVKY